MRALPRMTGWLGLAAALALAGCAATATPPQPVSTAGQPRVALLPLENLAGKPEAADVVTRVMFAALGQTGAVELVEPGDVEARLSEYRIRTSGMLTTEQAVKLAGRLRADYLMTGTILEFGTVHTPEGDVPSVGVSMRLLSNADGRVVWTAMRIRTGDDRETVFNWGRERSLERLTERTAAELFKRFRLPAPSDTLRSAGGKS